jgi:hypothetical protein
MNSLMSSLSGMVRDFLNVLITGYAKEGDTLFSPLTNKLLNTG